MGFEGATGKFGAKRALRVGVVGAGVMGTNHARVLAGLPDATLIGIVDPEIGDRRVAGDEIDGEGLVAHPFSLPRLLPFRTRALGVLMS